MLSKNLAKKNKVPGKEGKQDVNSVQQKKTRAKKAVGKARSKQVAEVVDEHGQESVEGGKMSAKNHVHIVTLKKKNVTPVK